MNDAYYELAVKRNRPELKYVLYVVIDLLACLVFLIAGFTKPLYWIGSAITLLFFYVYLRLRLYEEYEYILVNDELTIDAIFHKEARKALARCNVKDVQSIKLNADNEKGKDYSDGSHKVALYLNKGEVFLLSLDEKMLTMLKRYIRNIEQ